MCFHFVIRVRRCELDARRFAIPDTLPPCFSIAGSAGLKRPERMLQGTLTDDQGNGARASEIENGAKKSSSV